MVGLILSCSSGPPSAFSFQVFSVVECVVPLVPFLANLPRLAFFCFEFCAALFLKPLQKTRAD